MTSTAQRTQFHELAAKVLDELLERHPEWATVVGEHRHDERLDDRSAEAQADELAWAARRVADLEAMDDDLAPADRVDAATLRNTLLLRRLELEELREDTWDPLVSNPCTAVYTLLPLDFAHNIELLPSPTALPTALHDCLARAKRRASHRSLDTGERERSESEQNLKLTVVTNRDYSTFA